MAKSKPLGLLCRHGKTHTATNLNSVEVTSCMGLGTIKVLAKLRMLANLFCYEF